MDSDRVLVSPLLWFFVHFSNFSLSCQVLDHGKILEFDEPANLLSNTTSAFFKMAAETGDTELARLIDIAETAQEKNLEFRQGINEEENKSDSIPLHNGNPVA
jgi:ATP-binding cassette subfamily C (CFTR/MRP) protein 4